MASRYVWGGGEEAEVLIDVCLNNESNNLRDRGQKR